MSQEKASESKSAYMPGQVEDKWTAYWFGEGLFSLDVNPERPCFSIALPPPNITGNLHLGHALNGTLQDVLIRWKRMQGYNVLWQPGTDHAGISTQMVVERELKKQGVTRRDLGRKQFLEKVWHWRNQYGHQILEQYKRLGVSFCWDRMAFTMDDSYVKAITRAFNILYREGYIYRGNRVTNWCPRCLTSLSDLEVEHRQTKGHLYCIKYPLADGSGHLTVATTRPESLFGDVAVAVNPGDKRYRSMVGLQVLLPLTGRSVPVIADDYVDMEFGTGALKITPAHDINDFEVGQRHHLPAPVVIDQQGRLASCQYVPESLHGKERFAARQQVVDALNAEGLLAEKRDYEHGLGYCERCNTVIEPLLSEQWYVRMKELAEPAIKAVEEERIVFIPERYAATYLDWMKNIRDWCISRQLWWGHRIPVWTCNSCGKQDAFEGHPASCPACGATELTQDNDVLDTWFSSALWPFATLGWPEETAELSRFYPTTVLSTAREIINLWVARMIFTSLKFLGKIPFKYVLIHPVIQTADGKRMSKSKGNAIDPLLMIDKYGADANRFFFASLGVKGDQDVRFREDRLEEYRRFANKLWNAGRFVLGELKDYKPAGIERDKLTLADRWILHRYTTLLGDVHAGLRNYDFHDVCRSFYEFIWDYFCDWYVEIAKIQIVKDDTAGGDGQTRRVLHFIFEGLMRALHPIMPFLTEELWSRTAKFALYKDLASIMFAPYPRQDVSFLDEQAEEQMTLIVRTIRSIRNIRQTYNIPPSSEAEVLIYCGDDRQRSCLLAGQEFIRRLARVNPLAISASDSTLPGSAWDTVASSKIYVPLAKLIDIDKSKTKLKQRLDALEKDLLKTRQILDNADFKAKAPEDKVEAVRKQLTDLKEQKLSLVCQLDVLEKVEA